MQRVFVDDGSDIILKSAGSDENGLPSSVRGNQVTNNLVLMSITGSKGSISNLKNMLVSMGQALIEDKPLQLLFNGRLNMFYKRND